MPMTCRLLKALSFTTSVTALPNAVDIGLILSTFGDKYGTCITNGDTKSV